jgi:DNA-3-methyladenine glycosylase II
MVDGRPLATINHQPFRRKNLAQHTVAGRLKPRPPFDFDKSLDFAGSFSPAMGEQEVSGGSITKATSFGGQTVAFTVRSLGTVERPELEYTLVSDKQIGDGLRSAAEDRIGFYLSIDDDLQPFYEIASRDEAFTPVLARLYGQHQVKFITPFETAAWAVLSQRNPMAIARKVKDKVAAEYGGSISLGGVTYRAFPEALAIVSVPEGELFAIVKNEKRTDYLRAVACAFASADEDFLRHGSYQEVEAWLRGIKGIGAWSSAFIMLRGLGHMNWLPVEESRVSSAVSRRYNGGEPLTQGELKRIAADYGPYVGYWSYYMRVAG